MDSLFNWSWLTECPYIYPKWRAMDELEEGELPINKYPRAPDFHEPSFRAGTKREAARSCAAAEHTRALATFGAALGQMITFKYL